MKLIDFRFVLRNGEKVLQARHRKLISSENYLLGLLDLGSEPEEWNDWEDVPLVDLDEEAMP